MHITALENTQNTRNRLLAQTKPHRQLNNKQRNAADARCAPHWHRLLIPLFLCYCITITITIRLYLSVITYYYIILLRSLIIWTFFIVASPEDDVSSREARGMMMDYDHDMGHDEEEEMMTKVEPVEEPKAVKTDPWAGYYDFLINEGSFKFWAVFQVIFNHFHPAHR